MSENINNRPELNEEEKNALLEAVKLFGLAGDNLRIVNPSEEEEYQEWSLGGADKVAQAMEIKPKLAGTNNTEIDLKSIMKFQEMKDNNEIRNNLIKGQLKFSKTIEYFDLDKLVEVDDSVNFFAMPDNEEFLDLASSIEIYGIINPLIVMKSVETDKYIVLSGRSRLLVSRSLFAESGDMRFFKIPVIELDSATDPKLIQGLVISTNLKYRKLSKADLIRSILTLDECFSKIKAYRSEMNISKLIAQHAGVCRTTVNNYRELKYLCSMGMELIEQKKMNLYIGRMIAQKDRETQEFIIKGLGDDINDVRIVKSLIVDSNSTKSIDPNNEYLIKETWEKRVARAKEKIPPYTYVTVKVNFQEVETTLKTLTQMRKEFALKYNTTKKNSINSIFKVSVNDRDMIQYIKRGFAQQATLDKVLATDIESIVKTG